MAPKRYNTVLSFSLVGIVVLTALLYWSLSQLIWLPVARGLFYMVADLLGLDYVLFELPNQTFTNAPWLFAGTLLYLPVVTFLVSRFGFKKALVTMLLGPLPFAFMDAWGWAGTTAPTFVQFIPALLISAVVGAALHFLFLFLAARWPARATFIQGWALTAPLVKQARPQQHVLGELVSPTLVVVPQAKVEAPLADFQPMVVAPEPPTVKLEPVPTVTVTPVQAPIPVVEPVDVVNAEPVAEPPLVVEPTPIGTPPAIEEIAEKATPLQVLESTTEPAPELVPVDRVNESAPAKLVESSPAEPDSPAPARGVPVWVMVAGVVVVVVVGIILIAVAFR